jgi:hypothetical protein
MTNYQKGARFERAYIAMKEATGLWVAVRSAGSHSPIDVSLFPLKDGEMVYACQLKRGKKYMEKPTDEFINLKIKGNVQKLWVSKKDRGKIEEKRV